MKKIIFGLALITTIGISYSFTSIENNNAIFNENTIENTACKYGQCKATAKSTGSRCKHCVSSSGDSYCWQH